MRGAALTRFAILLAAVIAAFTAHAQGDGDLERIMKALAAQPSATARFTESRTSALLREPIRSAGTLAHGPGGRLEKHTTSPRDERLVVEGGTVTYQRADGERRTLRLADLPGVLAMIEGLRGTLAGDLDALRRHYRVELQGGYEAWKLFLLPRDAQMAELVSDVRIAGSRGDVREVEIREASGDRSVLALERAKP
jgi:Outer membrane lipoprotein carrier protein LolA-like